jgi:superfamily I DNA and RNA helicase
MKSLEKVNFGENVEDTHVTKEQIQEVNIKDKVFNLEPINPKMEKKHHRNVLSKTMTKNKIKKQKIQLMRLESLIQKLEHIA